MCWDQRHGLSHPAIPDLLATATAIERALCSAFPNLAWAITQGLLRNNGWIQCSLFSGSLSVTKVRLFLKFVSDSLDALNSLFCYRRSQGLGWEREGALNPMPLQGYLLTPGSLWHLAQGQGNWPPRRPPWAEACCAHSRPRMLSGINRDTSFKPASSKIHLIDPVPFNSQAWRHLIAS